MANSSSLNVAAAVVWLVLASITTPLTLWLCYQVFLQTRTVDQSDESARKKSNGQSPQSSPVARVRVDSAFEKPCWQCRFDKSNNLRMTVVSSIGFTLALMFQLLIAVVYAIRVFGNKDNKKENTRDLMIKPPSTILFLAQVVFKNTGYTIMTLVCFERLRLTFDRSQYALAEQTIKLFRIGLAVLTLASVMAMFVTGFFSTRIASYLVAPLIICFCIVSCWIVFKFFDQTSRLWKTNLITVTEDGQRNTSGSLSLSSMDSDISSEHSRHRLTLLLDTSLRLTISTSIAIVSTSFTLFLVVCNLYFGHRHDELSVAEMIANQFDLTLNVLCLLCTFKGASKYYLCVFGPIHRYFLSRNLPSFHSTH